MNKENSFPNHDRFKFRVWDNVRKEYNRYQSIYLAQEGGVCYPLLDGGMTFPDEDSEYIIEQCTGLRDVNGELIYEGDVIRYDKLYEGYTFVVKWKPDMVMFVLWDINKGGSAILGAGVEQCAEIIGNIHTMSVKSDPSDKSDLSEEASK